MELRRGNNVSSNLTAEPTSRKKLDLGTGIKLALRKQLGEPINSIIDKNFIIFLQSIEAAGDKETSADAAKLIEFLNKFGEASLREEY